MRKSFTLLLLVIFSYSLSAQTQLTSNQWQEDLRFLQKKVHSEYAFLFKKVTAKEFDHSVEQLHNQIPKMKDHEVIVALAGIVAQFGYGHTALWLNSWRSNTKHGFHQLPYNLQQFSDGIFVQGVHQDYKEALGAKVLKIGSTTVVAALELIKPVFSVENDQFFKVYGMHYLGVPEILHACKVIPNLEKITLTLEKNGKTFEMAFESIQTEKFPGQYSLMQSNGEWLDARQADKTPLWLRNLDEIYSYEYLPETKTIYVRQSQIMDDPSEDIPTFYSRVFDFIENNEVDKMILDLRLNGGGNNYKNKPVVTGLIKCEKVNQPGKLFVVTGGRTFSACQNLVNELENYTEAVFVGEPTGENVNFFGDNRTETLPNSHLPVRLSYLWWQDKDPRDNREWTAPTLAVDLSFEDYKNNNDPVLKAIEKYNWAKAPMEQLTELFIAGEKEELMTKAFQFVKDPQYRYINFESEINDAGYRLLSDKQFQSALEVFTFNTQLYPESANAWDSLAEATLATGDQAKAIELYKKAYSMDPDGFVGENATKMLEKIKLGE